MPCDHSYKGPKNDQGFTPLEKVHPVRKIFYDKTTKRSSLTGFTFLEILFMMIIMGVLLGISLPQFKKTYDHFQFRTTGQLLANVFNYLHQHSMIEGKIILLKFDVEKKEFWSQFQNSTSRLKTYHYPNDILLETDEPEINFYPDGSIDKVTIQLSGPYRQSINLTTKGVWGGAKLQNLP